MCGGADEKDGAATLTFSRARPRRARGAVGFDLAQNKSSPRFAGYCSGGASRGDAEAQRREGRDPEEGGENAILLPSPVRVSSRSSSAPPRELSPASQTLVYETTVLR